MIFLRISQMSIKFQFTNRYTLGMLISWHIVFIHYWNANNKTDGQIILIKSGFSIFSTILLFPIWNLKFDYRKIRDKAILLHPNSWGSIRKNIHVNTRQTFTGDGIITIPRMQSLVVLCAWRRVSLFFSLLGNTSWNWIKGGRGYPREMDRGTRLEGLSTLLFLLESTRWPLRRSASTLPYISGLSRRLRQQVAVKSDFSLSSVTKSELH